MYLTTEIKKEIFKKSGKNKSDKDTGSAESQIALFTHRINYLTQHLQTHPKDFSTRLGLLKLVGKRKRLLDHLYDTDIQRYRAAVSDNNLRK